MTQPCDSNGEVRLVRIQLVAREAIWVAPYAWDHARKDFESGVYPARIAKWLGVSESDVWNVAMQEGWAKPSISVVPDWIEYELRLSGCNPDWVLVDELHWFGEPALAWHDLPPVAWLTPLAFVALSLLSQVIGR